MPVLDDPAHDYAHPVESDPVWGESYFFFAYDPSANAGMHCGIRIRPNEGEIESHLALSLPGGNVAEMNYVGGASEMIDTVIENGGLRLECLEPMKRWKVSAETRVTRRDGEGTPIGTCRATLDLEYEALVPAIGTDGQSRQASSELTAKTGSIVGKGHFDQPGTWSGTITLDNTSWELSKSTSLGSRDKSWGARRWHEPQTWRWFAIAIDADLHFGGFFMQTDDGELHRGWVSNDGEFTSVKRWEVTSEFEADGFTPTVSDVRVIDKMDRAYDLHGLVTHKHRATPHPRTLIISPVVQFTYGDRQGYGLTDYLYQVADGKPIFTQT